MECEFYIALEDRSIMEYEFYIALEDRKRRQRSIMEYKFYTPLEGRRKERRNTFSSVLERILKLKILTWVVAN